MTFTTRCHTLTIYKTAGGQFRWRVTARNEKVVDAATEGYTQYRGVRRNLLTNGWNCVVNTGAFPPRRWIRGTKEMTFKVWQK